MTEPAGSTREVLELPFSTAETEEGPILDRRSGLLSIKYDAESESGGSVWTSLTFEGVLAIRETPDEACTPDLIEAYGSVREFVDSPWKEELRAEAGGENNPIVSRRHYFVYFDHYGCFEVLAESVSVSSTGSSKP